MTIIYDSREVRQLDRVVELLKKGESIALPTETVYGLAGLALNPSALAQIFKLKNRPTFDPLIVHVLGMDDVLPLVKNVHPLHYLLAKSFWPGPLTLLFEKTEVVPDLCTASTPYVAIRSPSHPVFRDVLRRLKQPLAAPSANRFGQISTTQAEDVVKELGPFGLGAVLDGGPSQLGIESTVVKIHSPEKGEASVEIVRPGSLAADRMIEVLGPNVKMTQRESGSGISEEHARLESPGLLKSHYAPRAPLLLFDNLDEVNKDWVVKNLKNYKYLEVFPDSRFRDRVLKLVPSTSRVTLSETSSDLEAAARLFRVLRQLDELNPQAILVGALPDSKQGLCPAIFDRLTRALSANSLPR